MPLNRIVKSDPKLLFSRVPELAPSITQVLSRVPPAETVSVPPKPFIVAEAPSKEIPSLTLNTLSVLSPFNTISLSSPSSPEPSFAPPNDSIFAAIVMLPPALRVIGLAEPPFWLDVSAIPPFALIALLTMIF